MGELLDITTWIPTIVLIMLTFLFKNLIKTRLTYSVKHEYDTKLKELDSELKNTEMRLSAQIQEKQREIDALRGGALSQITKRHELAYDKRSLALDLIWETVCNSSRLKNSLSVLTTIPIEEITKQTSIGEDLAGLVSELTTQIEFRDVNYFKQCYKQQPYISDLVWAYYLAYEAIIAQAIFTIHVIRSKLDPKYLAIADSKKLKLIQTALPELNIRSEGVYLLKAPECLKLLDSKLLEAIKLDLKAQDLDEQSVELAKKLISLANDVLKEQKTE